MVLAEEYNRLPRGGGGKSKASAFLNVVLKY